MTSGGWPYVTGQGLLQLQGEAFGMAMDLQSTANLVLIQRWTHVLVISSDVSEFYSQLAALLGFY